MWIYRYLSQSFPYQAGGKYSFLEYLDSVPLRSCGTLKPVTHELQLADHNQCVRFTTVAHPLLCGETTKNIRQCGKSRSNFKVPDVNPFTGLFSSISDGTVRNVRPFAVRFPRTTSVCMSSNTLRSTAALVCSGYQQSPKSCWCGVSNPGKRSSQAWSGQKARQMLHFGRAGRRKSNTDQRKKGLGYLHRQMAGCCQRRSWCTWCQWN